MSITINLSLFPFQPFVYSSLVEGGENTRFENVYIYFVFLESGYRRR